MFLAVDIVNIVKTVNSFINKIVWGEPFLVLIMGVGIFLTVRLGFFQAVKFKHWMKNTGGTILKRDKKQDKRQGSISQFQALCASLAGTVGTGNITGVAAAIATGGAGAVFWMWVAAFFGMMTKFSENVLGIYYRRKNVRGENVGGAMYYLSDGLKNKRFLKYAAKPLSVMFSVFCIFASFGIGNMMQSNNISVSVTSAFPVSGFCFFGIYFSPEFIIGLICALLAAVSILGGIKRVGSVAEKVVPFMAAVYVSGCLFVFFTHISFIGDIFTLIFKSAFGFDAVCGGSLGILISRTVTTGIKRGVFSNEAGLASSVSVNASSDVKEPVIQGMWGIFEVFFDTFIICTLTAVAVLSSGLVDLSTGLLTENIEGSSLVVAVFSSSMGKWGGIFVALASVFFSFSTILGWSQYGIKASEFLFGYKASGIYKAVFIVFTVIGAVSPMSLALDISDTFNGLMALPNLIGLLSLSGVVVSVTDNYVKRKFQKKDLPPMISAFDK